MSDLEQRKKEALEWFNRANWDGRIQQIKTIRALLQPAPSEWQKCPDCKNGMLTNCSETATVKK